MLEDLEKVSWKSLEHAYGEASDIPNQIRALASDDAQKRQAAISNFYGNIWHQGTIYNATIHAVPFFIELLEQPDIQDKDEILILLSYLAFGNSYGDVHRHLELFKDEQEALEFQKQVEVELGWVEAAYKAVVKGWTTYKELLADSLPNVRAAAAYLLGILPNNAWDKTQSLITCYWREKVLFVRTAYAFAIGCLAVNCKNGLDWLKMIDFDEDSAIQIVAALGIARSRPEKVSKRVVELLVQGATNPSEAKEIYAQLPWPDAEIQLDCSEALCWVNAHPKQVVNALVIAMEDVAPYHSWCIATALLNVVLGKKPLPSTITAAQLTPDQNKALRAIATSRTFWAGHGNHRTVLNVVEILEAFNLPQTPKRLKAFLAGELTPQNPEWSTYL